MPGWKIWKLGYGTSAVLRVYQSGHCGVNICTEKGLFLESHSVQNDMQVCMAKGE